jgi:hypothetical protein
MGQAKYDPGYDDRRPWNAGKFVGAKRPLTPKQVWKVRFHLERDRRLRDLARIIHEPSRQGFADPV